MAKKLKFTKTTTNKLAVKGLLSEDCATITYIDEEDMEQEVPLTHLLNAFKNCEVDISVSLKDEEELDIIPPVDEE